MDVECREVTKLGGYLVKDLVARGVSREVAFGLGESETMLKNRYRCSWQLP